MYGLRQASVLAYHNLSKLVTNGGYDYNSYLPEIALTPSIYAEMNNLLNTIMSDHILQQAEIKFFI